MHQTERHVNNQYPYSKPTPTTLVLGPVDGVDIDTLLDHLPEWAVNAKVSTDFKAVRERG